MGKFKVEGKWVLTVEDVVIQMETKPYQSNVLHANELGLGQHY